MRATAEKLERQSYAQAITWEDLSVAGSLVIGKVLEAIQNADLAVFDVTHLNPNVLFEIGYAISLGKPIWLTLDGSVSAAYDGWKEFALLSPVGFVKYRNSDELVAQFLAQDPVEKLTPLYDQIIEPKLPVVPEPRKSLLYCATFEPFEAANRIDGLIDDRQRKGRSLFVSDPKESSLNPITWYARILLRSGAVLVHFAGAGRNKAVIHNNRHALVAGMAVGFDTALFMVAERDYPAPFDYEHLLLKYDSGAQCVNSVRRWLEEITFDRVSWGTQRRTTNSGLQQLRFGEHVAENESDDLGDYFIHTSAYRDVTSSRNSLFVGHRGTGKTANAMQAFAEISSNKTNLPVLIKPPGFELSAIMHVVEKLPRVQHEYFFDSLWRFVVQTEIASTVLLAIEERPPSVPYSKSEKDFVSYVKRAPFQVRSDISIRLDQAIDALTIALDESPPQIETNRDQINEAFHARALAELRHNLGPVLKDKSRVAVFVDNLDKGWERGADFGILAQFILGLLVAQGRLVQDFSRHDSWREKIKLTVAVFLRSDIYNYLVREAREPDKLPISTISWRDSQTLLSVIEERFLASQPGTSDSNELWDRYFSADVKGMPTPEYISRLVLPRPRDIVYFCNSAIGRAIDRRHERVMEEDFLAAEETYSRYAYEALLVENGVTVPEMEDALYGFLGSSEILTTDRAEAAMCEAGIAPERCSTLLSKLISMSFLGMEIKTDEFHFPEAGTDFKRSDRLASLVHVDRGSRRLRIHPAFHNFLAVGL